MDHSSTNNAKDLLIADFWRVVTDAEALIKASASDGSADLAEVRARAEQSLAHIKTRLNDAQHSLRISGQQAVTATHDYVQHNPLTALGVAAGVGVLIGLLSGRRS
jgi:ElaB/YqjD/DUF883 family membrane-anchored ribosome-binding protein